MQVNIAHEIEAIIAKYKAASDTTYKAVTDPESVMSDGEATLAYLIGEQDAAFDALVSYLAMLGVISAETPDETEEV